MRYPFAGFVYRQARLAVEGDVGDGQSVIVPGIRLSLVPGQLCLKTDPNIRWPPDSLVAIECDSGRVRTQIARND